MPNETKPAGRKRGPKPKGETAMSGAERNRLYRQRKREQQAKGQGLPTPEEWARAQQALRLLNDDVMPRYREVRDRASKELQRLESRTNVDWEISDVYRQLVRVLFLLEPIQHLRKSKEPGAGYICGAPDTAAGTDNDYWFGSNLSEPEQRCPVCAARFLEFRQGNRTPGSVKFP